MWCDEYEWCGIVVGELLNWESDFVCVFWCVVVVGGIVDRGVDVVGEFLKYFWVYCGCGDDCGGFDVCF